MTHPLAFAAALPSPHDTIRLSLASLLLLSGCWAGGHIRYRDTPDLANVTLATGARKTVGGVESSSGEKTTFHVGQTAHQWTPQTELGPVHATRSGYSSC